MRIIKLDAKSWKGPLDFYDALLPALEAPHWHGKNANALVDSMLYGGINGIEPPYKIWIVGTARLSEDTMREIGYMVNDINRQQGIEKEIEFQIDL